MARRPLLGILGLLLASALTGCGGGEVAARKDVGPVPETTAKFSEKSLADRAAVLIALIDSELASASSARAPRLKFFKAITPAVVQTQLEIEAERAEVYAIQEAQKGGAKLPSDLAAELDNLNQRYKSKDPEELLRRVDAVPLDQLFTQTAIESASGTSAVAKDCFNLFGVHAADKSQSCPGHPILAKYPDFTGSIKRYVLLLNSGGAFKNYRALRAKSRASVGNSGALDTPSILPGILPYSERGQAYIDDVAAGIRADHLDQLYREFVSRIAP
ncbi:MAG: glucosaminidase domain-containing protein [Bdellovibrionales bacterium]|nr:glucosaminidase domain-containing protein [Bdellovibrionales bacterium]